MTASVRILLSKETDLRNEGYTVFTAGVKSAFLNAQMEDSDMVYAKPETLDPSKGTFTERLYGPRSAPRRWHDRLE